jgi:hypothetical protein
VAAKPPEPKQRNLSFGNSRTISPRRAGKLLGYSDKKVMRLVEQGLLVGRRAYEGAWWEIEYESVVNFLNRICSEPPQ